MADIAFPTASAPAAAGTRRRLFSTVAALALGGLALAAALPQARKVPDMIGHKLVTAIHAAEMAPMIEHVVASLSLPEAQLLDPAVGPALRSELMRRIEALDHDGVAIIGTDRRILWSSRDLTLRVDQAALDAVLAGEPVRVFLVEETGADGREQHVAKFLTPLRDGREVVGALLMRRDDSAAVEIIHNLSVTLFALFLGGAGLTGGAILFLVLRGQRARARAERELLQARNANLAEQLRLGREMSLLAELNEWLQSCRDLDELFGMVVRFLDVLLPGSRGSIYIYSNSRDVLDGAVSWGGAAHHAHIHPNDSWALRRGRTYEYGESAVRFACAHVAEPDPAPYLSIPFLAHGETVGLLHITYPEGLDETARARFRRMAQTCAEQVSLAIANVRMRDELRSQAVRDPLTGLFNRRYMMDRLRSLSERRGGAGFALVSIDIDRFKTFNDNHGHDAGDAVIKAVAEAMVACLPPKAFACRSGGEELAIVIPEAELAQGMETAEALRARVETTQVSHNGTLLPAVTVSVGVAASPRHGTQLAEVIQRADAALYTAKHRGRNRVIAADEAEAGILSGPAAAPPAPVTLAIAAE